MNKPTVAVKRVRHDDLVIGVTIALALQFSGAVILAARAEAGCACGVAEERQNDFYWENDKLGMRAYGPGEYHKWSGLDLFNKDVRGGGSCGELLHHPSSCGKWHVTPWKGILDNYTVGAGCGLGGVSVFGDDNWKSYPDWETSEILTNTAECVDFKLTYPACCYLGKMTYHITLRRGERFWRNEVSFERSNFREGYAVGPGLDLSQKRGHAGDVLELQTRGIVALFEKSRGPVEGSTMTAVVLDPKSAEGVEFRTDVLGCRILTVKKLPFAYYAGAAWSKAGEITTSKQWFDTVMSFEANLASHPLIRQGED